MKLTFTWATEGQELKGLWIIDSLGSPEKSPHAKKRVVSEIREVRLESDALTFKLPPNQLFAEFRLVEDNVATFGAAIGSLPVELATEPYLSALERHRVRLYREP